jgi:signal transduction histidine kinase
MHKQNEALKKVNSELDRFVYSASHDLRSPLASIMGLVNVARRDKSAEHVDYLGLIEKSVVKLGSFISDIIDFSRNARLDVIAETIEFETMLRDVFEDLRFVEQYEKIQRSILIRTTKGFRSDPKRVRIILSNLVGNAIKHHFPPQRNNPYVSIKVEDDKEGITVTVTDNGPGIEEQYLKDIFKMFFRATNRTPGSGLGLYIVEETVNKLQGKISVTSTWGEGTSFTVRLPNLLN